MALFNCLHIISLFLLFVLLCVRRPSKLLLLLEQLPLERSSFASSNESEEDDKEDREEEDDDDDDESFFFFFFLIMCFSFILSGDKNSPRKLSRENTSQKSQRNFTQPHNHAHDKDVRDDFDDVERKNIF